MIGVELGKTVMSLGMGPLGVLQPHSTLWSAHSPLGPGLAG